VNYGGYVREEEKGEASLKRVVYFNKRLKEAYKEESTNAIKLPSKSNPRDYFYTLCLMKRNSETQTSSKV